MMYGIETYTLKAEMKSADSSASIDFKKYNSVLCNCAFFQGSSMLHMQAKGT
jgi:hypothetical protein